MKAILFFALSIVFLLQLACTPVRIISTEAQEGISYQNYHTYNFMDLDVDLKNDSLSASNSDGIHLLKTAISKEMEELGFSKSDQPDLWVNIGIVVESKTQTRTTDIREAPIYIGQRRYHWESEEVVVGQYEVGTVSVDIVDAHRDEQVWEGVVAGTLSENEQKLQKRINKAMNQLFDEFSKVIKAEQVP